MFSQPTVIDRTARIISGTVRMSGDSCGSAWWSSWAPCAMGTGVAGQTVAAVVVGVVATAGHRRRAVA